MPDQEELFIESSEDLRALIQRLQQEGIERCAVDTEADSLHSYREKLCLIQLAAGDILAVIDPLKIDNEALLEFCNFLETQEVWMHGADFDMTLLLRTFGQVPPRILDTQLASRLVGHERFGLANLIEDYFQVVLSKSSQKADWGARPIKDKMLRYAYDDVRYLMTLADLLLAKLDDLGRRPWFEEWCTYCRDSVLDRKERSPEEVWRVSGWGNLDRKALAYLRELWYWRDQESQTRDWPPFRIMTNQMLLELASDAARGKEIRGAKGLNSGQAQRLRDALDKASNLPADQWPRRRLHSGGSREEIDAEAFKSLRAKRNAKAEELGLDPTLLATRGTLETLANNSGQARDLLMSWQYEALFGGGDSTGE